MEQAQQQQGGTFSCQGCGKSYRWKPELAGKKVRCKCGHVIAIPGAAAAPVRAAQGAQQRAAAPAKPKAAPAKAKAAPTPREEDDDLAGLYALAEEEKKSARSGAVQDVYRCPSCHQPMEVGAALCTSCGYNMKSGSRAARPAAAAPVAMGSAGFAGGGAMAAAAPAGSAASAILAYGTARRTAAERGDDDDGALLNLWVPLALLAFGLVASFASMMYFTDDPESFGFAALTIGLRMVVEMVMLAIGCLAAIKMLDVAFGSPGTAALKVAAIAVAPGAVAEIVRSFLPPGVAFMGAAILSALMYFSLFYYLFDLDLGEILVLTTIVWLIRTWAGMILVGLLLALIMGGASGHAGEGVSTVASAVSGTDSDGPSPDEEAADVIDKGWTWEAKAWINDSPGRIMSGLPNSNSKEVIEGYYTAGAKDVQLQRDGSSVTMLIVQLPRSKSDRAKVFDWAHQMSKKYGLADHDDHRQKYLVYYFQP